MLQKYFGDDIIQLMHENEVCLNSF